MKVFVSAACATIWASRSATAFTAIPTSPPGCSTTAVGGWNPTTRAEKEQGEEKENALTRRAFFGDVASVSAAAATTGSIVLGSPQPAHAIGGGIKKVNAKLSSLGLPQMTSLPDGFSPLLELWGKGPNRFPLLVNFAHPLDWVVTVPSIDLNSEDGTIQAGEYGKGDTATFFVYEEPGYVADIGNQPKSFYQDVLQKAISQKSANIYQNFKVTNIQPVKTTFQNQTYVIVDFKYQLVTGAGFEVDRKAIASITSQGNAVEALWCASTAVRYKKLEPKLRDIAGSFRVYADGLDMLVPKQDVVDMY